VFTVIFCNNQRRLISEHSPINMVLIIVILIVSFYKNRMAWARLILSSNVTPAIYIIYIKVGLFSFSTYFLCIKPCTKSIKYHLCLLVALRALYYDFSARDDGILHSFIIALSFFNGCFDLSHAYFMLNRWLFITFI
jgi:hypothetical protein